MPKQIIYSDNVLAKVKDGVNKLANAVKVTLGPRGRYVLLDRKFSVPVHTIDGVTVAKEIDLKDKFENMGAQLVREAAIKTNDLAGDGTTTVTVLTQALVEEGVRNVTAGTDPIRIVRGMNMALELGKEKIKELSREVTTKEAKAQIATISSGSKEIGDLVADAIEQSGKEGIVVVEEGVTANTEVTVIEGFQINRGWSNPYFVNNPGKMQTIFDNPKFLITDKRITSIKEIVELLQQAKSQEKSLVIIADEVTGDALPNLVMNNVKGNISCVVVKAPGFGERRKEMLEDIAFATGSTIVSDENGLSFKNTEYSHLGSAKKIIVSRDNTVIIGASAPADKLEERVNGIKVQLESAVSDYDKEKFQERISKLCGKISSISVGGTTESEMKSRKYKVEDAVHATRSAIDEGVVPGGGVTMLRVSKSLRSLYHKKISADEKIGISIVEKALESPLFNIAKNAGYKGDSEVEKVKVMRDESMGFNADNGEYGDMFEMGVIDPAKVERVALENAISIASLLLTSGCMVTDEPEPVFQQVEKEDPAYG